MTSVSWANWFGGVYITERNFFPQFAIDAPTYLDMYPEFVLPPAERKAFLTDRKGAIAGRKLAEQYGWKVGDADSAARHDLLRATGRSRCAASTTARTRSTDESTMFFHWAYLNETIKKIYPRRADQTGVFIVQLERSRTGGGGVGGDRRDVQELARRDADRDREGVPARRSSR